MRKIVCIIIFHLFDYSKEDMVEDRPQKHHIPIRGGKGSRSIYEGTKDYQSSLGKYIEFKEYVSENPRRATTTQKDEGRTYDQTKR